MSASAGLLFLAIGYLVFPAFGAFKMHQVKKAFSIEQTEQETLPTYKEEPAWKAARQIRNMGLIGLSIAIFGCIPLMGLPGMLLLIPGELSGITGSVLSGNASDRAWPAAILMTLIFPIALPAGVALGHWLEKGAYGLVFWSVILAWWIIALLIIRMMNT